MSVLADAEMRIAERDLMEADLPLSLTFTYWTDEFKRERVVRVTVVDDQPHVCLRYDASDICVLCGNEDYSTWPRPAIDGEATPCECGGVGSGCRCEKEA